MILSKLSERYWEVLALIDTKALRSRILDFAIQGKLTEQLESDGTAEELYQQIQAEKQALIKKGKLKREKPLPEIKPEEVPFEIPENWKWCSFSEIVAFHLGKTPERGNPSYWKNGIYNWITISDMPQNGHITKTNEKISQIACDDCFTCEISRVGTLIMSFKLTIGKVAILDIDSYHNEAIISIYPIFDDRNTTKNYLFLILPYISNMTESHGAIKGETLNKKSLSKMKLPLPPLAEQKRIVARVEEIFRLLDIIDEAQEKYAADSESLKAKLITLGIQGRLTKQLDSDGTAEELYQHIQQEKQKLIKEGKIKKEKPLPAISDEEIPFEIPENWKWVRWGNLSESIQYGYNAPAKESGRIRMVRITDIQNNSVQWQNVPFCDIEETAINDYLLQELAELLESPLLLPIFPKNQCMQDT